MSAAVATWRPLGPLAIVTAAAVLFAILLILVRVQWAPLEAIDHHAAAGLNRRVAGHPAAVSVIKTVTWLGSSGVLWTVTGTAAVVLAIRRRWRLAIYLLVAGAGALTLGSIVCYGARYLVFLPAPIYCQQNRRRPWIMTGPGNTAASPPASWWRGC